MKALRFFTLLTVAMLPQLASAYDFMVDGLCYNYNSDGTSVTVTYETLHEWESHYTNASGELVIPETVTYNGTNYSVTSIGSYAFYECYGLTSVTIPNSVTSIGERAFYYCYGLTSVTIPNSVTSIGSYAFYECYGMTSATIPNSVTKIPDYCFSGCSGLTSVTIPNSVTSISESAFEFCTGLTSVNIPNSVTSIGGYAFADCTGLTSVTIPNSVTSIGGYAFADCTGLTSVTIPNSVTMIYGGAFMDCTGLTSVYITDLAAWCNIEFEYDYHYGNSHYCGYYCDSNPLYYAHNLYLNGNKVTNLVIPDSVTTIKPAAFYGCSGLTSVTIPNSVTWIGEGAFYDCSGLTSMVLESGNTKYDSRSNCNAIIETATNTLIFGCKNTIIPNSVTSIGNGAFSGCSGLTSVTIPNSVTSIRGWAFYGCTGLTSVTIPNSVTWVGEKTFAYCSGLKSVYITDLAAWCNIVFDDSDKYDYLEHNEHYINYSNPLYYAHNLYLNGNKITNLVIQNSVTKINNYAFYGCSGLTSVTIPNSVTSIGESTFVGCTGLTAITVESGNLTYDSRNNCNAIIETQTNILKFGCENTIIPNSVTSIGESAFEYCTGLTSVTIPNSVTEIDSRAFIGCFGLTSIYSKIKNPENVWYGRDIFNDDHITRVRDFFNYDDNDALYYECTLFVPKGTSDIYHNIYPWGSGYYDDDYNYYFSYFSEIIEMDPTGDVNDDGTVNVGDYVATASYILEQDPQPFYFEECDFDDNYVINVGDLVGVAYIALHYGDEPMRAPAVGTKETPSLAMAADVIGKNGNYEVNINLSNDVDIAALQMDLNLPTGMTLVDASLSDRASASHQVAFNQLSNGDYRLLASSPTCKTFSDNDGAVLTLTLVGEPSGNGIINNIELATPRAASYKVDNIELNFTSPTGIEDITAATTTRIYSEGCNIVIISPNDDTAQIVLPNGINKTVKVAVGHNVYEAPAKGIVIVKMGNEVKKMRF